MRTSRAATGEYSRRIISDGQTEVVRIISHLSKWIEEAIDLASLQLQVHDLLPTQPEEDAAEFGEANSEKPRPTPNPLPNRYARWLFTLLCIVDEHLDANEMSTLRELARVAMKVAGWRLVTAVNSGEISDKGDASWSLGLTNGGASIVHATDGHTGSSPINGVPMLGSTLHNLPKDRLAAAEKADETGLNETLARCWLIVYAVATGWGQRDLLEELRNLFS